MSASLGGKGMGPRLGEDTGGGGERERAPTRDAPTGDGREGWLVGEELDQDDYDGKDADDGA